MDLKLKDNNSLVLFNDTLLNNADNKHIPVEYVQTTDDANITAISSLDWSKSFSTTIVFEVLSINQANAALYASFNGSSIHGNGCRAIFETSGSSTLNIRTATGGNVVQSISGKTTLYHTKNKITVNGVNKSGTSYSTTGTYPFKILSGDMSVRVYSMSIYYNGATVRNFVPSISLETGHIGEACLYDTVNSRYYYASNTGSLSIPSKESIYSKIYNAYIKGCPNISGINVIKSCFNLDRVRVDIGNQSGPFIEIYKYSFLNGFNDNYEQQVKPRIVGTFNINNFYIDSEVSNIRDRLDGTTVITPTAADYDVDYLLYNDLLAVQNLNDGVENYNPIVATILNNNGIGHNTDISFYPGFGTYLIKKTEAAAMTSWPIAMFRGNTTVETFNEFKYWTGLTSLPGGNGTTDVSRRGSFGGCTALESIEIPEGITTIGAVTFYGDSALSRIVLPSTLTTINDNNFNECSNLANVYFNGTLSNWMNISFHQTGISNPTSYGAHFYIDGEELTSLTIPQGTTSIKTSVFYGMKYITGQLVIPNTVTSIGAYAFSGCTGITGELIIPSTTSLNSQCFYSCTGITSVKCYSNSVGSNAFQACTGIKDYITYSANLLQIRDGGNNTGTIEYRNGVSAGNPNGVSFGKWKHVLVYGDVTASTGYGIFYSNSSATETVRIRGNYTNSGNGGLIYLVYNYYVKFFEIGGTFNKSIFYNITYTYNGFIEHLGYSNVAGAAANAQVSSSRCAKVYVGDGSSRANDEAVLALYLADSDWSTYSAKLGTWYDYNGVYKWYYVTDNLTNCTNTNPDEWPHITRGESYQTTIIPDEGRTLDSVTIVMYEALDNGTTPSTPTDITSIVYNSNTGEINIPSVTGNVIITAIAS